MQNQNKDNDAVSLQTILDRLDYGWRVYIEGKHIKTGVSVITYFDSYELLSDTLILKSSIDPSIHTCVGSLVESTDTYFRIEQKDSWSSSVLQFNWENPKLMASIEMLQFDLKNTIDKLDRFIYWVETKLQ